MQPATNRKHASEHLSTEQLYREHGRFVARLLVRLGVPADALDDTVQEVFLTVHRLGGYEFGRAKPTTYLATIACNAAASQRRVSRVRRTRVSEHAPEELPSADSDPLRTLEARAELSRLDDVLSRLDPNLRNTLLRADGEGESCVEIANATQVPLGTVYWRLDRARKKFLEAWSKVGTLPPRRAGERRLAALMGLLVPSRAGRWQPPRMWQALGGKLGLSFAAGLGAVAVSWLAFTGTPAQQPVTSAPAPTAQHTLAPTVQPLAIRDSEVAELNANESAVDQHGVELTSAAPTSAPRARARTRATGSTATRSSTSDAALLAAASASALPSEAARSAAPEPEDEQADATRERAALQTEMLELARAERLLERHPHDALAIVRKLKAAGGAPYLREERDYVELMALLGSGERSAGRLRAQAFLHAYPASAFAPRVRTRAELPAQ